MSPSVEMLLIVLVLVLLSGCGNDDATGLGLDAGVDAAAMHESDAAHGGDDAGDSGHARCPPIGTTQSSNFSPTPGCPCTLTKGKTYCCSGFAVACTKDGVWSEYFDDDATCGDGDGGRDVEDGGSRWRPQDIPECA